MIEEIIALVRAYLRDTTKEARIAFWYRIREGYCEACGEELKGWKCNCFAYKE